jgi:spermidine synthase
MARRAVIGIAEANGVRYLHFDEENVQGAMRVARPWKLELEYTREMLFPLLLAPLPQQPREILLIGLGPGSLVKFLHRHLPDAHLRVVEVLPEVVTAAYQYFRLPDDPARIDIVVGDGADIIAEPGPPYDLILVDGYNAAARCGRLADEEFHRLCRSRLGERGYCVFNLLGGGRRFKTAQQRICAHFPHTRFLPAGESGNVIAIAGNSTLEFDIESLADNIDIWRAATGLDLRPTLQRLRRQCGTP